MAKRVDRLGEIVEGARCRRKELTTPEGLLLDVWIAGKGERLVAFLLDLLFMLAATVGLYMLLAFMLLSDVNLAVGGTLILFASFLVRNMYFIHFELA